MLNSLNPILEKIFLFVKDGVMEVMDELDYIHDVIEKYKKKALIEYGELEKLRHKAYTYKTKKGKTRLGEPSKSN